MKGLGAVLRCSTYAVMATTGSSMRVTAKRLRWRGLSSAKKRSIRFGHEERVGMSG